jgi:hypothetical protein
MTKQAVADLIFMAVSSIQERDRMIAARDETICSMAHIRATPDTRLSAH